MEPERKNKIDFSLTGKSEPNIDFSEETNSLKSFGIMLGVL